MSQKFYKGRTTQQLTWVMVDSTDYATPESAVSAATKIKIYGKVRANDTVYLVSSGAGSLTNDIKHVGASALGIYTIGLAKADLSDASNAWYDQYIISLSATGCAYQTLVVDGGIDDSGLSALISDVQSAVLLVQSAASDAASAAVVGASRILLVQSRLSDFDSRLVSDISDVRSMLSDMMSDFQSRVPKAVATNSQLSDLHSDLRSYLVVMSGVQSDLYSLLSDFQSDFSSRVPKRVATDSQLSDLVSDLRSLAILNQSTVSDIYSGVQLLQSALIGHTGSTASQVANASALEIDGIDHDDQFNGYYVKLLGGSQIDELRLIVDTNKTASQIIVHPAFLSRVASGVDFVIVAGDPVASRFQSDALSRMSDVGSDLRSYLVGMSGMLSDVQSAVLLTQSAASDAYSAATQVNSRVLLNQSRLSDAYSLLSDFYSNFQSRVPKRVATDSQLSDVQSDLKSAIAAIAVSVSASDISDIASAVWANTIGARVDSRILVGQSYLSDIRSHVSDLQSDFQSRVPKRVATDSQLSDVQSDLKSAIGAITVTISASDVSDIASAVVAGLPIASTVSDIYSLLSDLYSDFQSRVPKRVATDSQLSDLASDVKSAVLLTQSLASDAYSAAAQAASRVLVAQSGVSDIYSLLSDVQSDFQSRVPKRVATDSQLSDLHSDLKSHLAVSSGIQSDLYSLLSDLQSDFGSRVPKRVATESQLSDLHSNLRSLAAATQSTASDIYSLLSDLHSDVGVLSGVVSDLSSGVNVTQINGVTLDGAGTPADPWGPV